MAKPDIQGDRTCCGVIQEAKYQSREKRARRSKPQPWIILKFAVGITIALIAYVSYVYIGRFCVPMLLKHESALGGQAVGVVFMVIYSPLFIMMIWTYSKVVFTPPGFAKDYVSKTEDPHKPPVFTPSLWNPDEVGSTKYEAIPNGDTRSLSHKYAPDQPFSAPQPENRSASKTDAETPEAYARRHKVSRSRLETPAKNQQSSHKAPGKTDVAPSVVSHSVSDGRDPEAEVSQSRNIPNSTQPLFTRAPPTTPILSPEYRYCYKDEIIKPFRAHHCRACGTCVLKFDHHCPWIGQCVGARNHKFFVNFLLWAALFCIWVFSTLLTMLIKQGSSFPGDVDPQQIIIIALAGMFGLFTAMLFTLHVHMISLGQTTVESVGFRDMRHREERTLGLMHPWYNIRATKETQRQWDAEWGKIGKEGNIWWLGSKKANWEAIMGRNVWWWFLPIGHSSSDGLDYPINPRFDSEGRWRRRAEWPPELR